MKLNLIVTSLVALFLCTVSFAQKKAIDEASLATWRRADDGSLSPDGRYVTYKYSFLAGERGTEGEIIYLFDNLTKKTITLDSASNLSFGAGGAWLTYMQGDKQMMMRMKDKKIMQWTKPGSPSFEHSESIVTYSTNGGKDIVYYNINSGDSVVFRNVSRVTSFDNGNMIIYQKKGEESYDICYGKPVKGAKHVTLYSDKTKTLDSYNFNSQTKKGRFSVAEKVGDKENCNLFYSFSIPDGKVNLELNKNEIQLESPLYIETNSFVFNSDKKYITFNVYATKPEPKKKYDKEKKDTSFELELWSWDDSVSQGIQSISGYRGEKAMPMIYAYNRETKNIYPVVTGSYSSIFYSNDPDCDYALLSDEYPHSKKGDWEHDQRANLHLIDLRTGERKLIKERTTHTASWSPKGDYILYYDSEEGGWMAVEPKSFTIKNISASIEVANRGYDRPNPRPSYGMTGWGVDGYTAYINDRYDIWAVDITGRKPTTCFTKEYGKKNNYCIRLVNPDFSTITVDPKKNCELEITDLTTMDDIMATLYTNGRIVKNVETPHSYRILKISADEKTYLYQRQSFSDDRDLWISDSKFKAPYKITNANPQQKDYKWGSVELVKWTNYEGKENRGLLYLPEGYEKGKSYPTIVNFYETHTEEKNIYHAPTYSSAMLDIPTYVSNGYIIFMPDVKFKIGEPGKSSYNAVVSGTKALIERGIIDSTRVGLQGHSWSGYQTSYLVTKTDMFTCVNIGAPIVNMTSAYNGIREGSGMPRMFMYEDWQCRMGSTMWESLDKFIESSPILYADKIKTPVLIFHCDKDEAVSFSEGRSLFLALRRLQQPAWMLNYKGEGHFVNKKPAMVDWTRRMRQFFDYYLNNTPMPRWMAEGINIEERGHDQKLDYKK